MLEGSTVTALNKGKGPFMKRLEQIVVCVLLWIVIFILPARGSTIYVMGSGDAATDSNVISILNNAGHTATLGSQLSSMDGAEDLSSYDAVYLQNSYNWDQSIMEAAALNLANYVTEQGGGLVTAEWTVWSAYTESGWEPIQEILPVEYVDYTYPTACTFTQVTADETINYNLGLSFDFVPSDSDGSFTHMILKPGATEYYSAKTDYDEDVTVGMAGWEVGENGGRVFSFSVILGADEMSEGSDPARLLANAFYWTANQSVPEPVTISLIAVFGGGMLVSRRIFKS